MTNLKKNAKQMLLMVAVVFLVLQLSFGQNIGKT